MEELALQNSLLERRSENRQEVDRYYSIEFSMGGRNLTYRFKIWNKATRSLCFFVREGADILPRLKVGSRLWMKYYHTDLSAPSDYLETVIRHVTKKERGPFRGCFLVGVEILNSRETEPLEVVS